jgi:hypothetical protein
LFIKERFCQNESNKEVKFKKEVDEIQKGQRNFIEGCVKTIVRCDTRKEHFRLIAVNRTNMSKTGVDKNNYFIFFDCDIRFSE